MEDDKRLPGIMLNKISVNKVSHFKFYTGIASQPVATGSNRLTSLLAKRSEDVSTIICQGSRCIYAEYWNEALADAGMSSCSMNSNRDDP